MSQRTRAETLPAHFESAMVGLRQSCTDVSGVETQQVPLILIATYCSQSKGLDLQATTLVYAGSSRYPAPLRSGKLLFRHCVLCNFTFTSYQAEAVAQIHVQVGKHQQGNQGTVSKHGKSKQMSRVRGSRTRHKRILSKRQQLAY